MDSLILPLIVVVAFGLGALIAWLFASRDSAAAKQTVESLRLQLTGVTEERDEARSRAEDVGTKLAAVTAQREERDRQYADRMAQLETQFTQLAEAALQKNEQSFLTRAEDRLGNALKPVRERLQKYEEQVAKVEQDRTEAYGNIKGLVEAMSGRLENLSGETSRLVMSLKGNPKTPGDWGQHHFENLIQLAQLTEHVDYEKERSFQSEEGRKRPDFIIRLPEGGRLVVDIKCSLDHYMSARAELDVGRRDAFLDSHASAVKKHAADLAKKSYYEDVAGSPDYVIMYLPGDHYLAAAMEADPELWRRAADKRVIIASPGTFLPLAHSLAAMWRSYKLSEDAQKIGRLGKEMHDRLAVAAEHLRVMGSGLGTAVKNYNKFVGSFERNVMTTGRKFRDLAIEPGAKELSEVPIVELLPQYSKDEVAARPLTKVASKPSNDDPPEMAAE
jgi:DNA recombination protein RmuC